MSFAKNALIPVIVFASISAACQKEAAAPVETVGARIENSELGLALASVPQPFAVAGSDESGWRFTAPTEAGTGTLIVSAGSVETGSINLVEVVKERRAWFESNGTYFGNRELGGPFGTIYTARGGYQAEGVEVEETWAFAIHPGEYRLLSIQYTYPTGESQVRIEQLMEFLGEIEPIGPAADESGE